MSSSRFSITHLVLVAALTGIGAIGGAQALRAQGSSGHADTAHIAAQPISADQLVVGFSPGVDGVRAIDVVVGAIAEAKQSIHVAAYSFTSKPVATALLEAHRRGVEVKIVVDKKENSSKSYTAATFTANEGIPTRTDDHYSIMHSKFVLVDGLNVETGSFNYSAAAVSHNEENALLIRNAPELAAVYEREWERLWAESEDLAARY